MSAITLSQLRKEWFAGDNTVVVELKDRREIAAWRKSMSSATWAAGPIGNTGWEKLAHISPPRKGAPVVTILVCKS